MSDQTACIFPYGNKQGNKVLKTSLINVGGVVHKNFCEWWRGKQDKNNMGWGLRDTQAHTLICCTPDKCGSSLLNNKQRYYG